MITKHTCHGGRGPVFGRRSGDCVRCLELLNGAPARRGGWGRTLDRRVAEARRMHEIAAHDCKARGCGPVCTAFDW